MRPDLRQSVYDQLHRITVKWEGAPDPEVDKLLNDLVTVERAVHQSMVIVGSVSV